MLARTQLRALRSISKQVTHPSSTQAWQPLLSRSSVVYSKQSFVQNRFYHNPNRLTPMGIPRQVGGLYRDSPFAMSFWTIVMFGILLYGGSILQKRYETIEAVRKIYPDSVAKELEKAIWYTNERSNLPGALECYIEAIMQAEKHGLSPFSPEVIGIRIRIAETFEIFGEYEPAIKALDDTRTDCQRFLTEEPWPISPSERIYILAMVIKISLKIADLYGSDEVQNSAAAERYLTEGIEMMLKEQQRQQAEGITEEELEVESRWFSSEEMGAAFERFAELYTQQRKHYLAAPLYLRALMHCPRNCHAAVLMNSLATSLALTKPDSGPNIRAEREALLDNATSWAKQALVLSREIKPPERDVQCDEMCVAATFNLGALAELRDRRDEARKLFTEALSLAEAIKSPGYINTVRIALRLLEDESSNESVVHRDPSRPTSTDE